MATEFEFDKHYEVIEADLLHEDELLAYQMLVDELSAENEKLKLEIAMLTPIKGGM